MTMFTPDTPLSNRVPPLPGGLWSHLSGTLTMLTYGVTSSINGIYTLYYDDGTLHVAQLVSTRVLLATMLPHSTADFTSSEQVFS